MLRNYPKLHSKSRTSDELKCDDGGLAPEPLLAAELKDTSLEEASHDTIEDPEMIPQRAYLVCCVSKNS